MRTRFSINLHVHSSRYTCIWPVALALISVGLTGVTDALAQDSNSPRAVSALGRLEPEYGTVHVSAQSTFEDVTWAVLATLLVKEGDDVTKGQLLATVGSTQVVQAKVTEAHAELNLRLREAEATRSTTEEACVRADVALREADRRARLHAQGVAGEEEADSAAGEAEAKAASCTAARTAVQAADARIEVARASLARHEAEYERTKLYAPIDGRVLEINTKPGERIDLEGVLELGNVNRMYAIAEIYETDIRHIRVGQKATVSSAALEKPLSGSVTFIRQKVEKQDEIGTDPAARKDARIIEVKILLDDSARAASLTNLQVDVVIQP
jgi:HlyD family secretion protein